MDVISSLDAYELSDRYDREDGRVFLTATQPIVRIPLAQPRRAPVLALTRAAIPPWLRARRAGRRSPQMGGNKSPRKKNANGFPARRERRSRRDRRARLATGRDASRPRGAGRVRALVRQGPRRRPLRRRAE